MPTLQEERIAVIREQLALGFTSGSYEGFTWELTITNA